MIATNNKVAETIYEYDKENALLRSHELNLNENNSLIIIFSRFDKLVKCRPK